VQAVEAAIYREPSADRIPETLKSGIFRNPSRLAIGSVDQSRIMVSLECQNVLEKCLGRVRRWRTPPNWQRSQWMEEARALASFTMTEAMHNVAPLGEASALDPGKLESRMLNGVLKRYRQEWSFARHCWSQLNFEPPERSEPDDSIQFMVPHLNEAILTLSQQDQQLLRMLYWEHHTESRIAADSGISQQAISKRKRRIFSELAKNLKGTHFSTSRL